MNSSSLTFKNSNTPVSGRVSNATDRQLQKGLDAIKKGDEYRDRGDFDKAQIQYEKAHKLYPSEARARLVILPLCKTSMESSDPDRFMSVGLRARLHNVKEKVKHVGKRPDPTPIQQQSFFPRPMLSTQSTVASLAVSNFQSTSMSVSTCMTATTSTSQSTTNTLSTLASETIVADIDTASDVRSLTAAYETADYGAREYIKKKIYDIINEFRPGEVTFDTVQELVVLADIRDPEIFLHIVTKILHVLRDSTLLSDIALQGLAVILDSFPDDTDLSSAQGAFLEILKPLQERLRGIRPVNNDLQVVPLLSALNALLDAMVRGGVFGLDREAVYNGLRTSLDGLTSHSNVMVCFQALYAKQALAIIGNDESLPMSIFRRGKLALALAGNISNLATKFEVASAESAYQNIKDFFDFSIRDGWYQGLIYVDYLLGQRSWWQLEDFVLRSKFQTDICFQLGIVLRLEQIAIAENDTTVRDGAVEFLTALRDSPIPLVPEMVQSTLQRLERLISSTGGLKDDDGATPMTCQGDPRPVWDPAWLATPKGILFRAVQSRDSQNMIIQNLPAQLDAINQTLQSRDSTVAQASLEEVQSALKTYYERHLDILRVSGDKLPLETCFVNLAIVEAPAQREKDKQDLKEQAAVYHRIPSSEAVGHVNMQTAIPLEQLFNKRKLRDGKEDIPKTILVQGRAGVGKTTLCKKLVHAHQTGLWRDLFDAILWLPLRQIKGYQTSTLEDLLRKKFFTRGLDQDRTALADELAISAQQGRVLFVLDGLDEVAKDTQREDSFVLKDFLADLLRQQHVIITSRPSGVDRSLLPPSIDLELETIGFSEKNVNDFVSNVLSPKATETVQRFILETPLIQGLVNIPVQLDVICYSWDSLPTEGPTIGMTGLYQLMVRKLWCKDALRLNKSAKAESLTQKDLNELEPQEIDELMATEMQHLGYLAFKGLMNDHQIEFDEHALRTAFRDLEKYRTAAKDRHLAPQLLKMMKETSFLHTADADLDASKSESQRAWYFLHLTFQEYFAATWVAQHLQKPVSTGMEDYFAATSSTKDRQQPLPMGMMTVEHAKAFVQEHKYNPRYEIMWWMVAGLLEGEALEDFFDLFQGTPRDSIGGRHQQILAFCLNEARARLNPTVVMKMDAELMKWVHFEIQTFHDESSTSILGSQSSFPEALLIKTLSSKTVSKDILLHTLGTRSTLSDAAILSLIGALKDEDKDVRSAAAGALYKQSTLSEAAILSLIGTLEHKDKQARFLAASALGNQSKLPEAAILSLIGALKGDDKDVRSTAASALGNKSKLPEAAILSLIGALKDEDEYVRSSAVKALGNKSMLSEAAILALVDALKDEDKYVQYSAFTALGEQSALSEVAVLSLIGALMGDDKDVRSAAAKALGNQSTLSEAAVLSLICALKGDDKDVRSTAAEALGNQSAFSEAAILSITGALEDEREFGMSSAFTALDKQSTLSESTILSLNGALEEERQFIRSSAAWVLGKQPTLTEAAILSLIDALKDEDKYVRASAAEALGNKSTLSEAAILSLIDALKDEDKYVRASAAEALDNQSALSEAAILSLIGTLKGNDKDVRSTAAEALGNQSAFSEAAILSITGALEDEREFVRSSAFTALDKQSTLSESAILSLNGALEEERQFVRSSAAWVLGKQPTLTEAAILSLIDALKDEDKYVRASAAEALGNQSALSEAAVLSLIGALEDEDEDVRSSAASALGKQSTLSEAAVLSLTGALSDEDEYVIVSAAMAFGNQSTLSEVAILSLTGALEDKREFVKSSAFTALDKQSTLSEAAVLSLIGALEDEDEDVSSTAASRLGKQSTLSEAAILSLIRAFKKGNARVKRDIAFILSIDARSVCTALPRLSETEIAYIYKNFLFHYCCRHALSLQIQANRLCYFTEQGLVRTEPVEADKAALIAAVFEAVQQEAWAHI